MRKARVAALNLAREGRQPYLNNCFPLHHKNGLQLPELSLYQTLAIAAEAPFPLRSRPPRNTEWQLYLDYRAPAQLPNLGTSATVSMWVCIVEIQRESARQSHRRGRHFARYRDT